MTYVVTILLAIGLYYVVSDKIGFPSLAAIRATSRIWGGKVSAKERIIYPIARKLEGFIHLDQYKRRELESTLRAAGMNMTPEFFTAAALANAGIMFVAGIAIFPVIHLGTPVLIVFAFYTFFKDMHSAAEILQKKRVAIENELQQFTSAIVQALGRRQDLFHIIQAYRRIAGEELGKEIDILITEMRTGNRSEALSNFESRIDSPLVSELCRGLVGVDRGDDMKAYLTAVEMHAKDFKISNLKKEAAKRPEKLALASFVLFGAMLAMYAAVMIVQLISNYKSLM